MRPDGRDVSIKCLKRKAQHDFLIESVTLLETGRKLDFDRTEKELLIKTEGYKSSKPICFKIEIS